MATSPFKEGDLRMVYGNFIGNFDVKIFIGTLTNNLGSFFLLPFKKTFV